MWTAAAGTVDVGFDLIGKKVQVMVEFILWLQHCIVLCPGGEAVVLFLSNGPGH
jgi:hypothetical protein